uniref:Ig-like domain-containing protein n=1 Tax=Macrostomum lignano TaxID=282301 RepID=A0A1I8J3T4_9PLAT
VGASSLPLELQLEDPCRASWEALNGIDRWRSLDGSSGTAMLPVAFLLFSSSQQLQWSALNLQGRTAPMQLKETRNPFCLNCEPLTWRPGDRIGFSVSSCGSQTLGCSVRLANGSRREAELFKISRPGSDRIRVTHFEYFVEETEIPRTLTCWQGNPAALQIEREIAATCKSRDLRVQRSFRALYTDKGSFTLSVSLMWVSGRKVLLEAEAQRFFPEPRIQCSIRAVTEQPLKVESQNRSVVKDNKSRVLLSVRSRFSFHASLSMHGGQILCWVNLTGSKNHVTSTVKKKLNITQISEPCQTAVDLGSSPYWEVDQTRQIAVTSSACSIWNVSHSCRLLQADGASPVPLRRVEQSSFSSAHLLQVSRSMAHQNWSVRCSVNQSGVVYDEAESLEQLRPLIFYPFSTVYAFPLSHLLLASGSVIAVIVMVGIASSVITWRVSRSRLAAVAAQRRGGGALRMQPLAAVASAGAGSSAYDYPSTNATAQGSRSHSEAGESNNIPSVYLVLSPSRRSQQQQQLVSSFEPRQQS